MSDPDEQGVLGADDVRVVSGNPTAEEIAAASAVLAALVAERAGARAEPIEPSPSTWQRSQRAIRGTIVPGPGRWRGFSG
ncbi:acyl-CoA carboxylase subunit epsilon [Planctomonas psychrotolerans]|uniref:acyl-CoA carboxylase subunit epsilon n=1 Tax=Planctomonas psychrotolerans TaxID=2528712 RepID=UPI00123A97C0|nr:acyl-CoA carboxylase subunit epsilon [Planctomonas psychrotolerans]